MKTKALFFFIFTFSIFSLSAAQQKEKKPNAKQLIGRWEAVNNSPGTSIVYDYKPNHEFGYLLASGFDGKYKLIGNRLIATYMIPSLKKPRTDTSYVFVRSDTLYQITVQNGKEVGYKMVRLNGKARPGAGIIGQWTNAAAIKNNIINFSANGKLEVRNVLRKIEGKYFVDGDNVSVISRGAEAMKNRFAFDNGMLLLYAKGVAAPIKLKRIKN